MIARAKSETGLTLIETVIALSMLLVAMIGLLSMAALATVYTENHGHLEARTTEYAQDKMEQLLAIAFTMQ
jgi:Tfp pilus assembly protein PilV